MGQYLAFDLGAESGRAILGRLSAGRLSLEELHRFPNVPVCVFDAIYWDTFLLWHEIEQGLAAAGREGVALDGVAVDTWGVDFALLGSDGMLVDNPRHYRDPRNSGMVERLFEVVPKEEIFAQTGIQFMQLNTLCQLRAMRLRGSPALHTARKLLFMPDLFNYWLTGVPRNELTIASTSQFYNQTTGGWADELFDRFDLPKEVLGEVVQPGTPLAPVMESVAARASLHSTPMVYATASHDTAAAVAAVPAEYPGWCYISSGTWSLLGVETDAPVITDESLRLNMTNEAGFGGKTRLLKNIAGMWPLQECRRAWAREGVEFTYDDLVRMAEDAQPFTAVIDPDVFLEPGDMPRRIAEHCRFHNQAPPSGPPEYARTIFESLALRYRAVLESLEKLTGEPIDTVHIVGGGSRNRLLNQFVSDCTDRTVIAGPAEATAVGNIIVQAIGAGELSGLEEARAVVRRSFPLHTFTPGGSTGWDDAYERYRKLARS